VNSLSGHLRLRAAARTDGRTALTDQSFRAPFHLSKPYWDPDSQTLLVQVVNPTAGILAGDRLQSEIGVDANATLLVTTPSASRAFTMNTGRAECLQRFTVGANGWLEVSPEPLVPHRRCDYRQVTEVNVAPGGGLFFADQLLPGRIGHGESWEWQRLCLDLTIRIGGDLVLRERFDHSGSELRELANFCGASTTACFANAVLLGTGKTNDGVWLPKLRELHQHGVWIGVSALRHGGWSIKIVVPDPMRLRDTLREVRRLLSDQFPRLACNPRKL
jgi:urease accessory protein